ncbi:ATP-binding cassette domain-containing protein [Mesorhizobium sp. Root102]|uniref:ABC transporter ATP-binding protein/permease n=1 Tax=Mesorhizobium sp. Root102 TaxID=1736422 RepID=UPI000AEEDA09|nr:ATP-binding cassette domain-containing protein [Mesorhizobium sp. Root102]
MRWLSRRSVEQKPATPVSSMRSFSGLMAAYWRSKKWPEAWGLTSVIIILTALSALASVWFAEVSGQLVSAIALLHRPENPATLRTILESAATLAAIVVLKDVGFIAVRHYFSTTLHRRWRAWLDQRLNDALLDSNHTHYHLQHGATHAIPPNIPVPDNIDQRVQESIKGMAGGAIGVAMGIAGVLLSLVFVGRKIVETSAPVDGLPFFGGYGSAFLTLVAVVAYVPIATFVATKLGGVLQVLDNTMQRAEGSYRGALNTLLHNSFYTAAASGEIAQKGIHKRRYLDIDRTWARLNKLVSGYMAFELFYNFLGSRIVAYAPGLLPYVDNEISLQVYITGAELANALIIDCSWFIHVMPDISTLKANSGRLTELARAIQDVQRPREFYARTGLSELRYSTQDPKLGLTLDDLELMHEGDDAPFIRTGEHHFKPGEWTLLVGESGSGKSSLFKAINRLWPHGRGTTILPESVRSLYAAQDVNLPPISLKELICMPDLVEAHSDVDVAVALTKAGLAEFAGDLAQEGRNGHSWDQLLSGGQKQKIILARILLLQPGLLFLDESTSALDPDATVAFHQAIKDACPSATVISIMHDATPPISVTGKGFYDSVVTIANGTTRKEPLADTKGGPVGPARVMPVPKAKEREDVRPRPSGQG